MPGPVMFLYEPIHFCVTPGGRHVILLVLQMGKLSHRPLSQPQNSYITVEGHMVSEWQSPDLNPGGLAAEPTLLTAF